MHKCPEETVVDGIVGISDTTRAGGPGGCPSPTPFVTSSLSDCILFQSSPGLPSLTMCLERIFVQGGGDRMLPSLGSGVPCLKVALAQILYSWSNEAPQSRG